MPSLGSPHILLMVPGPFLQTGTQGLTLSRTVLRTQDRGKSERTCCLDARVGVSGRGTAACVEYLYAVFVFRELFIRLRHLFEKHWSGSSLFTLLEGELLQKGGGVLAASHGSVLGRPGLEWCRLVRT